jgi:UPF0716 protein FxsA
MTTPVTPQVRPRRSRARTILPLAVAIWALLEIWLLMVVARDAGGLTVLLLLAAGLVLGAAAVKRAGRSAWRQLAAAGRPGTQDAETGTDNAAVAMLGGLLLMVPGLVSDAAGLLCLFPPTRSLLRRAARRALGRRISYDPGSLGDLLQQARIHRPDGKIVHGEVVQGEVVHPDTKKNPGPQR